VDRDPVDRVLGVVATAILGLDQDREDRDCDPEHDPAGERERLGADPAPQHEEDADGEERHAAGREHEPEGERDGDGDERRAAGGQAGQMG